MRERTAFAACSVGLLACLGACGGGSPPAPQAPAVARSATPPPPPPPDLSPVPDPPALVLSARILKPRASLATVHAWSKLPMPESEQVTELVAGDALGPLVDLDQPIDVAVALGGSGARSLQPMAAVSVPLKDPEGARALLSEHFKLVPGENGTALVQGLGHAAHKEEADDEDEDDKGPGEERTCELAPAFGSASVRLVCGWHPRALAELGPWLTRTATRAATKSDVHVDLRMQPVKGVIAEQRRFLGMLMSGALSARSGSPGERELLTSVAGDAADFASDLDTVALDLTLADAGASATAELKLSGKSSAAGRVATSHPERNGPAPAAFWQLPGDADFAVFQRGTDEADLARIRDLLSKVLGDALGDVGVKDVDRKAVLDALAKVAAAPPMVYASGVDVPAAKKALAASKAAASRPDSPEFAEAKRSAAEELLGWRVLEIDEASTKATSALKALAAAWARPGVAAAYRAKINGPAPSLRAAPLSKGAALPAGSAHYVFEVALEPAPRGGGGKSGPDDKDKKKAAPTAKPIAVHVLVAPDGARTWVSIAGDEALGAAKLAATLRSSSAGPAATSGTAAGQGDPGLTSRAELAALKAGPIGAGGFLTLRGIAETATLGEVLLGGSLHESAENLDEASQMPGQGIAAIPFSLTAQPGGPPATTVAALQVPRGAIEDLVAAILRHGGF